MEQRSKPTAPKLVVWVHVTLRSFNREQFLPRVTLFILFSISTNSTFAEALSVDNFVLLDHTGVSHELYDHSDAKAIVLMIQGNGCQIVRSNLPELKRLRDNYVDQEVVFFMMNSNLQDTRTAIREETREWNIDIPILHDRAQIIGRSLTVRRTGEVLVIDPRTWNVVYRGPLSDRVSYERQKKHAQNHYVKDVLDVLLAGGDSEVSRVNSPGCIINFETRDNATVSYAEVIAPILKSHCLDCHVEGGIAPWAMSSYSMVRGFAPMMREVLRTQRMPPWHADPEVGHWRDDKSLSIHELRLLIAWIESGTPRGSGDDPLVSSPEPKSQDIWPLGEPDLIVELPAFDIPASGIVDYRFPNVMSPLERDVWVIAATIVPGDPQAVHHMLAGSSLIAPKDDQIKNIFDNFILTYTPGNESGFMPEGTGVYVPQGSVFQFQVHYTPYGKKSVDRSRIGLYFADEPPENFYREFVIVNPDLQVPAFKADHEEHAYFNFWADATIYALFPHAHYRGVSSRFELIYPDGREEVLLSVPNFDFNWQRSYTLENPKQVPAGTKIVHRTIYDNSTKNRGNPDPSSDVFWGLQSEQEMLYGSISFSWIHETTKKPLHKKRFTDISQLMGFWDQDLDDRVSQEEIPPRILTQIGINWSLFDQDSDGGMDINEFSFMLYQVSAH